MDKKGLLIAGIGGNYDVCLEDGSVVRVKARGVFRKEKITPLIGDRVMVSEEGFITDILPRKNQMIRPAAANIDQALIVFALRDPAPHFGVLDRFLAEAIRQDIPSLIVFNKTDLVDREKDTRLMEAVDAYRQSGFKVFLMEARSGSSEEATENPYHQLKELEKELGGKITVLAGPSGVGKSSLINALIDAGQEVGELSEKIMRGKNTTRHARLLSIASEEGGWIADTPGFTSFHTQEIEAEDLDGIYPEFAPYLGKCYYPDCHHIKEPGCQVRLAVKNGAVPKLRYKNYRDLFEELRQYRKEHPLYENK